MAFDFIIVQDFYDIFRSDGPIIQHSTSALRIIISDIRHITHPTSSSEFEFLKRV